MLKRQFDVQGLDNTVAPSVLVLPLKSGEPASVNTAIYVPGIDVPLTSPGDDKTKLALSPSWGFEHLRESVDPILDFIDLTNGQ
ncbi:MAG: hypothetical protein H7240_10340 [Glaciimonas sp.]|nr:hypothetical protein [Glaciimonas sp.]